MLLLDDDLNTDETPVFRTTHGGTVFVSASSGAAGSTVYDTMTVQVSFDNSTFFTYAPAGTAAVIEALGIHEYNIPGGLYCRVDGGASTAYVKVDIGGNAVVMD